MKTLRKVLRVSLFLILLLNIKNSKAQYECELINNTYFGQEERELSSCSDLLNYKLDNK